MRVAVIGAGYVGLVTGVCLAAQGHEVSCVEMDASRVAQINGGHPPIEEQGLPELLRSVLASGMFQATRDLDAALEGAELSLIAVGTPSEAGRINLGFVLEAARQIGTRIPGLKGPHTVVVKSTVVPGTTEGPVRKALEEASGLRAGEDFGLGMNPEFLRESTAVADFQDPDRIVIGALDRRAAETLDRLYASFSCPKLHVSPTNAELIKYASNALLATLVSFGNEIFSIAEALPGGNGRCALETLHTDRRWEADSRTGRPAMLSYLMGGIGYGGSCLPKDTLALQARARDLDVPTPQLDGTIRTNTLRPAMVVDVLARKLGPLSGRTLAVLGLAFKPGTDDTRESPAFPLVDALLQRGAHVRVWDPLAGAASARWNGRAILAGNAEDVLTGADGVVLATAWPELKEWDWPALLKRMSNPFILDGRGLLADLAWPSGTYETLGRGPATAVERP